MSRSLSVCYVRVGVDLESQSRTGRVEKTIMVKVIRPSPTLKEGRKQKGFAKRDLKANCSDDRTGI